MKSRRLMTVALVSSLVVCGVSASVRAASPGQDALRANAQAELATVTVDVDRANIMYSPADNGVGPNFTKVEQYQQEYRSARISRMVNTPARCSICAEPTRLSAARLIGTNPSS